MKRVAVSIMLSTMLVLSLAQKMLTPEQRKELLNAHNYFRREVVRNGDAADMKIMEWNNELESFAFEHIKICKMEHSSPESRKKGTAGESYIGENLWSTSADEAKNLTSAVEAWYKEIEFYTYDSGACVAGKMCGHYTQLIWANSYKVGCAVTSKGQCAGKTMPTQLACNYAPGGNWLGQKPYETGGGGEGCKTCKDGFEAFCIKGLCSKVENEDKLIPEVAPTASPTKEASAANNCRLTCGMCALLLNLAVTF